MAGYDLRHVARCLRELCERVLRAARRMLPIPQGQEVATRVVSVVPVAPTPPSPRSTPLAPAPDSLQRMPVLLCENRGSGRNMAHSSHTDATGAEHADLEGSIESLRDVACSAPLSLEEAIVKPGSRTTSSADCSVTASTPAALRDIHARPETGTQREDAVEFWSVEDLDEAEIAHNARLCRQGRSSGTFTRPLGSVPMPAAKDIRPLTSSSCLPQVGECHVESLPGQVDCGAARAQGSHCRTAYEATHVRCFGAAVS